MILSALPSLLRCSARPALVLLLAASAQPCGPYWETFHLAVRTLPDGDPADWRAGRLGLIQPGLNTTDLVVAWRWLSGVGLNAAEQAALVPRTQAQVSGSDAWAKARAEAGAAPRAVEQGRMEAYAYLPIIGDHALTLAAATLQARVRTFGKDSAAVKAWLEAQDQVFDLGRKDLPQDAPASLPLPIRQDRAYQQAAARFYREDYAGALAGFRALAKTDGHPWQAWSRYMVARIRMRVKGDIAGFTEGPAEAFAHLEALEKDPHTRDFREDAAALHNRLLFQEDAPTFYTTLLKHLYTRDRGPALRQDLEDLRWLRVLEPWGQGEGAGLKGIPPAGVHAWIRAFQAPDATLALAGYDAEPSLPWLVAVLTRLTPDHPRTEAFLKLAQTACAKPGPAYPSLVTHRLRLLLAQKRFQAAEALADEALATPGASRWPTAWNLWSSVKVARARSLDAFAQHLGRRLASWEADGEVTESRPIPPDGAPKGAGAANRIQAFDVAAANLLNQDLPLAQWEALLAAPTFPEALRPELLEALWARAAVLGREDVMRRQGQALAQARPAYAKDLAAWAADTDPVRRRARAYLLVWDHRLWPQVLKHRAEAFQYGTEFQRWGDYKPEEPAHERALVALPLDPLPPFLDAATRKAGQAEARQIAMPLTWFCREALAFAEARPRDPLAPGALSRAVRSSRKATRDDQSAALVVKAFRLLHKAYPDSKEAGEAKVYH